MTKVALFVAVLLTWVPAAASANARHHAKHRVTHVTPAAQIPVSFRVVNANTSDVPCSADGDSYTVEGTLFLPAGGVPAGTTVYVHGLGYAGYFWDFTAVPGYDYAATEAADGHSSVVIDRLGYGASSIPNGSATCVGSQASIVHQIVQQLRDGSYHATGHSAPAFSRIGLVGHSAGGQLAEVEAYSYRDINALGVMEWADAGYSVGTYAAFGADAGQCATGGAAQVGSTSKGYAKFGATTAEYDSLMFAGVDPAVEAAANRLRTLDPCGQIESILTGVAIDAANVGSIKVPIAYVHAGLDGIFQAGLPWPQLQEALYSSTPALTDISLPGFGHAVTLERSAPALEAAMNKWLTANRL